jgi:hypothetical protein
MTLSYNTAGLPWKKAQFEKELIRMEAKNGI